MLRYCITMANFKDCPTFAVHDDYYTPRYAWEQISHLIPKDVVIYEPFCLNSILSESAKHLEEITRNVVLSDTTWDFFKVGAVVKQSVLSCDKKICIVSNPPYDRKILEPALKELINLDIPFIILLNSNTIYTNYFNNIFKNHRKHLQIVFPSGKINFEKYDPETKTKSTTSKNPFYCTYVCYKMNIPTKSLYLDKRIKAKTTEKTKKQLKAQLAVKKALDNYKTFFRELIIEDLEKEVEAEV